MNSFYFKYELDKFKKKNTFKDYILPSTTIIISLVTLIVVVVNNAENNKTLRDLKNDELKTNRQIKKFEISYIPKINFLVELIIQYKRFYREIGAYCELTNEPQTKYTKEEKVEILSQRDSVENCLDRIDICTNKIYPYLKADDRDSLIIHSNDFQRETRKFIYGIYLFYGETKFEYYRRMICDDYSDYITFLKEQEFEDNPLTEK
ncbi:MAG: hypothetical protein JSS63_12465 [Bacteroidetes bacterium]|nr:hypothetical protein [Bacteroidota bacterium]